MDTLSGLHFWGGQQETAVNGGLDLLQPLIVGSGGDEHEVLEASSVCARGRSTRGGLIAHSMTPGWTKEASHCHRIGFHR